MNRPVRTTIVFSLASGLLAVPIAMMIDAYLLWPSGLKLTLWASVAAYALLMARWSVARLPAMLLPLAILLGMAVWPRTQGGFYILALGIFSWMRSGICFRGAPLRSLAAEVVTVAGGAGLVLLIGSFSYVAWGLTIGLFFLIQSLYFFIVPLRSGQTDPPVSEDPFEKAVEDAKKVLEGF